MKAILTVGLLLATTLLGAENAFLNAGIPATDREWNGRDYATTSRILGEGKVLRPVLTDEQGKPLIARITDTSNFTFNRNKTLPIGTRLEDFLQIQQGLNGILKQYAFAANRGEALNSEIARLLAFSLHVSALGIDLVNEFLPTIPKDESYQTRMDGLKQMYSGLTTSFGGAEVSLAETKFYSQSDLRVILAAMEATLPTMQQAFSADYRTELEKKLEKHLDHFDGNDEKLLNSMLKTLKTEQGGGGQSATRSESK